MTDICVTHRWDIEPTEAIALQRTLAQRLILEPCTAMISSVAGIDVSIRAGLARAAIVVLAYPSLVKVEHRTAVMPVTYPYIPGLLTFREAPTALKALGELAAIPDLLMFDGQGYAHPRRLGLASHLGLLLNRPSIGCAKSRLCGVCEMPGWERGSRSMLMDHEEAVGAAVRTRSGVRPVYVSPGHLIDLSQSISMVLSTGRGYRLPEPTRLAHRLSTQWVQDI